MKQTIAIISFFLNFMCIAQEKCIENEKIGLGGDFNSIIYSLHCPTYNFSFNGDKSNNWNILNDPIYINQVDKKILPLKVRLEKKLKEFVGDKLFSKFEFYSVEISYPDSIKKFKDRSPSVDMKECKGKYFFYYYIIPTEHIKYCVGIALDENENIISNFNFPSKSDYKVIDDNLDLCNAFKIAKTTHKEIEPIDKISFEFDQKNKLFYWSIVQKIVNPQEGENEFLEVVIDAADMGKVLLVKRKTYIQF